MARIRSIKPEFFMSDDVGELTIESRLLYIALWCHADRDGILKFQRTALKAQTMPFNMTQFDSCVDELIENGHAILYEVESKFYLYLPTFTEHQRPHKTEKESGLPMCASTSNGSLTVKDTLSNRKEREREGEREGEGSLGKERSLGTGMDLRNNGDSTVSHLRKQKNGSAEFESFWKIYPKRKNKGQALKAWIKITNPVETLDLITQALSWQARSPDWTKNGGQYIPYPATYLNAEAWMDEPTAPPMNGADEWLAEQMEKDAAIDGDFKHEH